MLSLGFWYSIQNARLSIYCSCCGPHLLQQEQECTHCCSWDSHCAVLIQQHGVQICLLCLHFLHTLLVCLLASIAQWHVHFFLFCILQLIAHFSNLIRFILCFFLFWHPLVKWPIVLLVNGFMGFVYVAHKGCCNQTQLNLSWFFEWCWIQTQLNPSWSFWMMLNVGSEWNSWSGRTFVHRKPHQLQI